MRARLSLDLSAQTRRDLEALVMKTNSTTITDTIKRSIALLELVHEHTESGGKVIFRKPDGTEETLRFL